MGEGWPSWSALVPLYGVGVLCAALSAPFDVVATVVLVLVPFACNGLALWPSARHVVGWPRPRWPAGAAGPPPTQVAT